MRVVVEVLPRVAALFGLVAFSCAGAAEPGQSTYERGEEHRITVTGTPEFRESRWGIAKMILPPVDGSPVEVEFNAEGASWYKELPKDKVFTFILWRRMDVVVVGGGRRLHVPGSTEIETIRDGEKIWFDAALCPLHGMRMERTEILLMRTPPSLALLRALPQFSAGPGFRLEPMIGSNSASLPGTGRGYKCAGCVAAYEKWKRETPDQASN